MSPSDGTPGSARSARFSTPQGWIHFKPPTPAQIERLQILLPFGMQIHEPEPGHVEYQIVTQSGEDEIRFLKQQPPEVPREDFKTVMYANHILTASSFAQHLVEAGKGLFWPVSYFREKSTGVEAGIAYWGRDNDSEASDVGDLTTAFDDDFSPGFTQAVVTFIEIMKAESQITGITMQPCIGLDVRGCRHLEQISFDFLILDQEVICLKSLLHPNDATWTVLRAQGIDTLIHVPASSLRL